MHERVAAIGDRHCSFGDRGKLLAAMSAESTASAAHHLYGMNSVTGSMINAMRPSQIAHVGGMIESSGSLSSDPSEPKREAAIGLAFRATELNVELALSGSG
jgi:hypothetical protein